jgi:transposase-like protein
MTINILFIKSNVRQHLRRLKDGRVITIRAHKDSRGDGKKKQYQERFDKHINVVVEMYRSGLGIKQIGKNIGVSHGVIRNWLQRVGEYEPVANIVTPEQKSTVIEMYMDATPIRDICSRVGVSKSSIYKITRDSGIQRGRSEAMAVRAEREAMSGFYRGRTGFFQSIKNNKFIQSSSSYESARMRQLDSDHDVVYWGRCKDKIPYSFDGKTSIYVPDFEVVRHDGSIFIEEIKPDNFIEDSRNLAKFNAARKFYQGIGKTFVVISEGDIGKEAIIQARKDGFFGVNDDAMIRRKLDLGREATRRYRNNMTDEERKVARQKQNEARKARYRSDPEYRNNIKARVSERQKSKLTAMTPEQLKEYNRKIRERRSSKNITKSMPILFFVRPSP